MCGGRSRLRRASGRTLSRQHGADFGDVGHIHGAGFCLDTARFRAFKVARVPFEDQRHTPAILYTHALKPVRGAEGSADPLFETARLSLFTPKHAGYSLMHTLWGAHILSVPIWP